MLRTKERQQNSFPASSRTFVRASRSRGARPAPPVFRFTKSTGETKESLIKTSDLAFEVY
jgi:hypothetical protein